MEPQKTSTIGTLVFRGFVCTSLLGIGTCVVGGLYTHAVSKDPPPPPPKAGVVAAPRLSPPPPPRDYKREYAPDLAQDIVEKMLRAPSTAVWLTREVVAAQSPHYIVHVVVDAQNAFGAQIRDSYLTALEVIDATRYKSTPFSAMIRCSNPPTESEIAQMKNANWPAAK